MGLQACKCYSHVAPVRRIEVLVWLSPQQLSGLAVANALCIAKGNHRIETTNGRWNKVAQGRSVFLDFSTISRPVVSASLGHRRVEGVRVIDSA